MKHELGETIRKQIVGLRAKRYSYVNENSDEHKKVKGAEICHIFMSTWCFEHSGDISCSLLVNLSHTDESWEGRNTCIYKYEYDHICKCLLQSSCFVANTYFQYKVTTPISGNYPSAKMTTDFRRSYYIELNSTNPKLRFLGQESEISGKECYFTILET